MGAEKLTRILMTDGGNSKSVANTCTNELYKKAIDGPIGLYFSKLKL